LKTIILLLALGLSYSAKAQKVDSIYLNLYTDSLKKGTYNYINVDGLLSNGNYMPLDSSHLYFTSSYGTFSGNNLWIDDRVYDKDILIQVRLKTDTTIQKTVLLRVKKKEEEKLKTAEELLEEMKKQRRNKS
jgi:hypothetical protein